MDALEASQIRLSGVDVRVLERCSSTNTVLLASGAERAALLACDEQTAGRGRRGRRWHSAPGRSITFSLATPVRRPLRELASLSLVAGVACVRALRAMGAATLALKWPNDLLVDAAKVGGILVETRAQAGSTLAVIGVGLNFASTRTLGARVRQRIAFLDQHIRDSSRNEVIRAVAAALLDSLAAFEAKGLQAVRTDWEAMDAHAGQRLRVRLADGRVVSGIASGLAADGALRLRTRAGLRSVTSGRVVSSRRA